MEAQKETFEKILLGLLPLNLLSLISLFVYGEYIRDKESVLFFGGLFIGLFFALLIVIWVFLLGKHKTK
jgi:hypothetical protein